MPVLSLLTKEESEVFLHLIQNKQNELDDSKRRTSILIDE
jgi:hypothetical protein